VRRLGPGGDETWCVPKARNSTARVAGPAHYPQVMGRKPARQSVAAVYDRRTPFPRKKADATPSELAAPLAKTQGSSMLATQGCRMESRWDSPLEFVGKDQRRHPQSPEIPIVGFHQPLAQHCKILFLTPEQATAPGFLCSKQDDNAARDASSPYGEILALLPERNVFSFRFRWFRFASPPAVTLLSLRLNPGRRSSKTTNKLALMALTGLGCRILHRRCLFLNLTHF